MTRLATILGVLFVLLSACATVPAIWQARLYPASGPLAGTSAPLLGQFVQSPDGHGRATIQYPDGTKCAGEYSSLYQGATARLTLWQGATVQSVVGAVGGNVGYGMSSATCSDGTFLECSYTVDRGSGHGNGLCKDSRGNSFNLHF